MLRLFGYLWKVRGYAAAVILLLVVQAYCDLSLPQYTSDIVDVGIQQGGIEDAVLEKISGETFTGLSLFLDEAEEELLQQCYEENAEGIYELQEIEEDIREQLNGALSVPMVLIYGMEASGEMDMSQLQAMYASGMIDKAQILSMKEEYLAQSSDISETMTAQVAVEFAKAEYESLGMDLNQIQSDYLWRTGGKMIALSLLMLAAAIAGGFLSAKAGATIGKGLRNDVFEKVVSFSNGEINRFSTASLITRSTNDIQQVQMVCVMLLRMVFYAPIIGIGGVLKVIHTRTGLGWIIVVAVGLIILLVGTLVSITMPKFKKLQVLVDNVNRVSREILTGVSVIRAFSREKTEEGRFDKASLELKETQLFTNRVMTFMMPLMMLIMNGITILIVWFGAKGIDLGQMQVGDMIAFITYTMQIVMSFLMLTMMSIMLPRAGVAADRIQEVLDTKPTISDPEQAKDEALRGRGVLAFHDVSFRYPQAEEDALEHISFVAEPGKTTAIIGSTGCGKTTLLQTILRFYDVTEGSITLDGVDIRQLSQKKLRSYMGYVPQKGVLFSGNIASNLKFGGDDISEEDMKQAASIAQATEFIEEKPDKYNSPIAQGGTNVSGGQKQRLSIARAIAKHPKIFLFDDSFSALDYKTDAALRRALAEQVGDATVLIVAQRISTILHADQILVMEDGRIVGQGTHEWLLQNCPTYMEIAKSQLSEADLQKAGVQSTKLQRTEVQPAGGENKEQQRTTAPTVDSQCVASLLHDGKGGEA